MTSVALPFPHSCIYLQYLYPFRSCSPLVPGYVCFRSLLVLIPCIIHIHLEKDLVSRMVRWVA